MLKIVELRLKVIRRKYHDAVKLNAIRSYSGICLAGDATSESKNSVECGESIKPRISGDARALCKNIK